MKNEDDFTDLLKAGASQVTAFAKAPGAACTLRQQPGQDLRAGPAPQTGGTYESDVFDAKIFSRWGRADYRGTGNIELFARSGNVDNPDRNWSPWKKSTTRAARPVFLRPALRSGRQCCTPEARRRAWTASPSITCRKTWRRTSMMSGCRSPSVTCRFRSRWAQRWT